MKILLVYTGYTVREVPLNVLYISAALKKAGHATRVFELTPYKKRPVFGDRNRIIKSDENTCLSESTIRISGTKLFPLTKVR